MIKRSDKEQVVQQLSTLFAESHSIFVTDYIGLDVAKLTEFRKSLRQKNLKYKVAKNTLFRIAAKQHGLEHLSGHLRGPTALAFGGADPAVPAKLLFDFNKQHGKPEVRAIFIDGVAYDKAMLKALAELPPRNELIARVVGALVAPMSSLVGTLDGVIREFCTTIDQIAKQKSQG